ncbi:hypothetical protein ACLB1M_32385 [Escherichia coli]
MKNCSSSVIWRRKCLTREPEKRLTWLQVRFPRATVLVLTPEPIARYNLPAIPHNDADADIHRHYVATLCLQVLHCRPHAGFTE